MLTINGNATGRIADHGEDALGRFCWVSMRGKRDEGVCIIVGYRCCHEHYHRPGPFTSYTTQYTALRAKGVKKRTPGGSSCMMS